jgi:hypothetical protein
VSYFRPRQAGKIGPRTIHGFPDLTSQLSQNAGQVNPAKCALSECLKLRVHSKTRLLFSKTADKIRLAKCQGCHDGTNPRTSCSTQPRQASAA